MRIVIGYDGSACAKAAIDDLPRAGLPPKTEAVVAAAADLWPVHPDWTYEELSPAQQERLPLTVRGAYEIAMGAIREASSLADEGVDRVRSICPTWEVSRAVSPGSPAASLIKLAAERHADLLVVGSRGRSQLSGLILGSVSRKVLALAWCSIRIGRGVRDGQDPLRPVRIILGMDGSPCAALAAAAVGARWWPAGSEVRVVAALDAPLTAAFFAVNLLTTGAGYSTRYENEEIWIGHVTDSVAEELRDSHLQTSIVVREGDARKVLLDEAERFHGDCIFLGATGHGRFPRLALGSVSMAVAEHAPCTVEVVRHDAQARQEHEVMTT